MYRNTKIIVVAAHDLNRAIGLKGGFPWPRIPGDLPRVKELTMGYPVIMGRKTFETIVAPLPGRTTIVVSASGAVFPRGVDGFRSLAGALAYASGCPGGNEQVFVFGGAQIYRKVLESYEVDCLHLTVLLERYEAADAFFPEYEEQFCRVVSRDSCVTRVGEEELRYEVVVRERA